MLHIACVKAGKLYGPEYVNILRDMVSRNLPEGFCARFVCFTDDGEGIDPSIDIEPIPHGLEGWWAKLALFREGSFPSGDRILYFDLDTVITGRLDEIVAYDGPFAILRDAYRPDGLQSSVMAWKPDIDVSLLWDRWLLYGKPETPGGDQEWIEKQIIFVPGILQDLYPGLFVSYKKDARFGIPRGSSVVFFHGEPKPHQVTDGWVPYVWKIGGGSSAELLLVANVPVETIMANIKNAVERYKITSQIDKRETLAGASDVSVKQSVNENMFQMQERASEDKSAILFDLPCGFHADMAQNPSSDIRTTTQGQCSELRGSLQTAREAQGGVLPNMRAESSDASSGLQSASSGGMAMPNPSSRASCSPSWITMQPVRPGREIAIVAGGPSLKEEMPSLWAHLNSGADVMACNNALTFLRNQGVNNHDVRNLYHVIADARPENLAFVPEPEFRAVRLYSSQCHPSVLEKAGERLLLWHPYMPGIFDIVGLDEPGPFIGGGTTAGLKAICLAMALGYRKIHLYGFDSSYRDGEGHAYAQPLNDGERIIDAFVGGKQFKAAPWMVTQAEEFRDLVPELIALGIELYVHGDGMIPTIAIELEKLSFICSDIRAKEIIERLPEDKEIVGVELGVFTGDLSRRLLTRRQKLKLFMVDNWGDGISDDRKSIPDYHVNLSEQEQQRAERVARESVSIFGDRAIIHKMDTAKSAEIIGDVDFAFIDADHFYNGCKADINAWAPRVKLFLSGHDYDNPDYPEWGVKQAVEEFISESGWQLELGENFTWFAYPKEQRA